MSVALEGARSDKRLLILPGLFFLSPFLTAAVPRLTWLFLILIAIALFVRAWRQGIVWRELIPLDATSLAVILFAAYVTVNATWAADRGGGFEKAALLWALAIVTIAAGSAIAALDERQLRLAALGLGAGAALGVAFLLIELATGAVITRAVINSSSLLRPEKAKHVFMSNGFVKKMSLSELNQNVTIVMLSLWPATAALSLVTTGRRRIAFLVLLLLATAIAVLASQHQSSQVALILSLPAFGLAWLWRKGVIRALAVLWCLAFALVLPLDFAAFKGELHMARWLPDSARARVILWEYTAERVLEHPWLGIGVDSTHALKKSGKLERPPGYVFPLSSGEHAHNLFLQTWYELGFFGALLFAIAGAVAALRMLRLPPESQPFAAASFAAFLGIGAFAWGIWQTWFMCAIALFVLYLRLATSAPKAAAP
ncbi:MAG TPA: O-antigen ligase family protein [Methyloceanibacter sp.]|nr:O-antigen ligase family protein [Methyloceanibacter sp.]